VFMLLSELKLSLGPVRSTVPHGPRSGPVRSMGPHGPGPHGPFSGLTRTGPPLDRTKARHGPVHGPGTVRSGLVHGHGPVRDGLDRTGFFNTLDPTPSVPSKTSLRALNIKTGLGSLGTIPNYSGSVKHENRTRQTRYHPKLVRQRQT
jgi:hypothetical protein